MKIFRGFMRVSVLFGIAIACLASREVMAIGQRSASVDEGVSDWRPWLTGPLLSPSASTVPQGHINVEPYIYTNNNIGSYNDEWHLHKFPVSSHNINLLVVFQVGLSPKVDLTLVPQGFYNWVGNDAAESFRFGDLGTALGFQLVKEDLHGWVPGVKFTLGEIFPTGEYQNLDPLKFGTDGSGSGSFATTFRLTFSKLFSFYGPHYLATRFALWSTLFSPVSVHGFNSYGGDNKTDGTMHPGTIFSTIAGFEYTLTKHWAVALDILASYGTGASFTSNIPGVFNPNGNTSSPGGRGPIIIDTPTDDLEIDFLAPVGNPNPSFSFSLAPAIEYNFNKNYGLIMGLWFSAFGKNSIYFLNGVVALNIYI